MPITLWKQKHAATLYTIKSSLPVDEKEEVVAEANTSAVQSLCLPLVVLAPIQTELCKQSRSQL